MKLLLCFLSVFGQALACECMDKLKWYEEEIKATCEIMNEKEYLWNESSQYFFNKGKICTYYQIIELLNDNDF